MLCISKYYFNNKGKLRIQIRTYRVKTELVSTENSKIWRESNIKSNFIKFPELNGIIKISNTYFILNGSGMHMNFLDIILISLSLHLMIPYVAL